MTPVLSLRGVSKVHPGGVRALDRVDLDVLPGELLAIVGPSGSGKSTMLHLMGTLDRPSEGVLRIGGQDVTALSDPSLSALRARRIGFVFQHFHLNEGASAVENVTTGMLYAGVPRKARGPRALAALRRVGLAHRSGHRPHELSGGEQQRVAIARALVGDPAIVLADEPTGALDTANSASVLALLRELNAEGATIVVITHDRELAASLPRQVEVLDGRVRSDSCLPGGRL